MIPNPTFVKKLKLYDPDLRVVWSLTKECWLVERKIRRHKPCLDYPIGVAPDPDTLRRARDGYVHVGNVPPRMLDERVLLTLWQNDMWAHGGAKAINHALDDYYETKERREAITQRDDLKQVAGDMWDFLAWKRGGKMRVPERVEAS